jgi:hypothetical protein
VAQRFFVEVNQHARRFMSDEHFTGDGTLIQAWALQKSFRSKDGSDVRTVRELSAPPHVTKNDKGRRSNLHRRITRPPGDAVRLSRRWLGRTGFCMAEADRPAAPGHAARLKEGGLAVRLRLRGARLRAMSLHAPHKITLACVVHFRQIMPRSSAAFRWRPRPTRRQFLKNSTCLAGLYPFRSLALPATGLPPVFQQVPPSISGIHWIHTAGKSPQKHLPETSGAGCAFLDYDNDGWMDIYLVNSGKADFYTPPKPLRNALYRNVQHHGKQHQRHRVCSLA